MSFLMQWFKVTLLVFGATFVVGPVVSMLNIPTDGIADEIAGAAVVSAVVVLGKRFF